MTSTAQEIVSTLEGHVGNKLRVVAEYGEEDYNFHYLREDVAESYTEEELYDLFRDLILEGMAREHLETIFHLGAFECAIVQFSDGIVFHFAQEDYSGFAVSIDADAEFEFLSFVTDCKEWIKSESTVE